MLHIFIFYLNSIQRLVPGLSALCLDLFERHVTQLLQVEFCLLWTDERRGDTGMHLLASFGLKTDDGTSVVDRCLGGTLFDLTISHCSFVCERLVKLDDKIILEIVGYTPTVACCISYDFVF